jgi:hypothetical protein
VRGPIPSLKVLAGMKGGTLAGWHPVMEVYRKSSQFVARAISVEIVVIKSPPVATEKFDPVGIYQLYKRPFGFFR